MEITIRNPEQQYDVIIAGGGPAGCAAAIAAARQGAKTLVIEAASCLGGMATAGLVSKWAPMDDQEKVIYRSIAYEVVDRYKKRAGIPEEKWRWINLYPEELKRVYDDMFDECGAKALFCSRVVDAQVEDGKIARLIVANKAGLTAYTAHTYIDCTGDADVAAFAGVPFEMGDEEGNVQASSLCFIIANFDYSKRKHKVLSSNPKEGLWATIRREKKYPRLAKHFIPAYRGNGVIFANAGHLKGLDSTDPEAVSAALAEGRRIAEDCLAALKEYEPEAFENACLVATAPSIGIRESRRIKGDYCLTLQDYLARRSFEDEICRNSYWLDCHGKSKAMEGLDIKQYGPGDSHGIPFRCMIPVGIENLLVAGRSISMERTALAAVRVMPNCLGMGEAAGIAAAIAARDGLTTRQVDIKKVQAEIK